MDGHFVFGLAASGVCVGFFLAKGRKTDLVSWIGLVIGIALIFAITTHWDEIAMLVRHGAATQSAAASSHIAAHPTPSTVVKLHATPTAVKHGTALPSHQGTIRPAMPSSQEQASAFLHLLGNIVAVIFALVIVLLVIILICAAHRRPAVSHILHQELCPRCSQLRNDLNEYQWREGRKQMIQGKLCSACAQGLRATVVA